jgi:NFU1 iron-sulfur cluster scaffold homolog, mitochondrial
MSDVMVSTEPVDDFRYNFIVNRSVNDQAPGVYRFVSAADAASAPVAEAILGIPGIEEVILSDRTVAVVRGAGVEWCDLEERVRYAITSAVTALNAVTHAPARASKMDDDTMYEVVTELFRGTINPSVAQHGGAVELIDVQDATVVLRMKGGCQGCGMANVTLRQGIEATLKRAVPGFKGIQDVTDHSAGTDPYFSSAKE